MKVRHCLTDKDVQSIANAARHFAQQHNWPVAIAIVDDGGHLLNLQRLEDAAPMTVEMATAKARTAALTRRPTQFYEELILGQGRLSFLATPMTGLLEGGLPIYVRDNVIGAIAVSGVSSAQDTQVAQSGIDALEQA
ncbi:GlcG/HbpS family heme-binding protein [Halomonas sp. AOP12-C2-37]|uniref:Heme-binding protein n=1 Tax=Halomonas citrativorans TaxID=2742612 RepID=A0A1R4HXZ7_9GAMM|nr:heme-binding protein [Halomonas citrativorans]MBE0402386.1 heme-binding protein [Halomonas citrativorans]SJN12412.1 Protein GlcG [Halomonas citrativorans]